MARLRLYLWLRLAGRLRAVLLVALLLTAIGTAAVAGLVFWQQSFSQLRSEARRAAGSEAETLGCYEQFASSRSGVGGSRGGTMRCFFVAPGDSTVLRAGKINEVSGSLAPTRPDDADVAFKDGRHWVTMSYSTTVAGDVVYGHRLDGGRTLIVVTVTDNAALRPTG